MLANGDWMPGGIIVVATLIGLAGQIPVIRKLCNDPAAPSPPTRTPTGHPQ